ncbi:RIB43A-like with coiled-coils protein 1 [Gouania willdenowi]|uniref:RIB43A-like with coiled-coils protein 1 n=1 Tax=Gouania willdenowi TaxID=441366 RepID=A0A8C5GZZ9_GOUWI|nr:RIB43A-like with coiled-coils protein 1 [Gouania willdenowi]XP_028307850.1 RIB43A-like with coiled-coils protein 1 [Gouania willdenowi]XP_028307851.1 RIB43A-like with coiled-coils protein 1 [Gouania willdenowi]
MYQPDLTVGRPTTTAAERRRSAEEARKTRIFNTHQRVMGVDVNALNQQVQERKLQESVEKQRDNAFDNLRNYNDKVLLLQETNEKEKQEAIHADLVQFWTTNQRKNDSINAHLNSNPKGPYNLTIPESQLGPSSMHLFQGEGIGDEQKRREQMKANERDLHAQMDEDKRRHMANQHRDMLISKGLVKQDLQWAEQAAFEEDLRKEAHLTLDNYNQALAVDQTEKVKERQRREVRQNFAEQVHILTSDMMTEVAQREGRGGRPDSYKGMNAEEVNRFNIEKAEQLRQRQRQQDGERFQDTLWDLHFMKLSRQAEEQEMREAELKREQRIQMDQYNSQLAMEQQARQEFLEKKLYTNKPTEDFFRQFNTSSR